jgi:hypothetical protein
MSRKKFRRTRVFLVLFLTILFSAGVVTAEPRTATIGDVVPLSGTAIGYDVVYLFMTGPGVPSAGSRMDSSISPVVTGNPNTFTQVPVNDGEWNYTWNTGRVSGGLAEGQYTIYSATQPVSAQDLPGVPYDSIYINLYRPIITGSISVYSSPSNAQVTVNGRYSGNTPLNLTSLNPGNYEIDASLQGYLPERENITVQAGEKKEVDFTLQPVASPTTITTIPATTAVLPTTSPRPQPTTRAPFPLLAFATGITLGMFLFRKSR